MNPFDGGPAFPRPTGHDGSLDHEGMSLRVWLAGQALTGLCTDRQCSGASVDDFAALAISLADAVIAKVTHDYD